MPQSTNLRIPEGRIDVLVQIRHNYAGIATTETENLAFARNMSIYDSFGAYPEDAVFHVVAYGLACCLINIVAYVVVSSLSSSNMDVLKKPSISNRVSASTHACSKYITLILDSSTPSRTLSTLSNLFAYLSTTFCALASQSCSLVLYIIGLN